MSTPAQQNGEEEKSRKPDATPFKQQKLQAWQPILTPRWVFGTFLTISVIFIPIGVVLLTASNQVVEYRVQYDGPGTDANYKGMNLTKCALNKLEDGNQFSDSHTCTIDFNITETMNPPIYVYYELNNFYQNHRRYVQSKDDDQLRGTASYDNPATCSESPINTIMKNSTFNITESGWTSPADRNPYPCGLIATSMFNDIIKLRTRELTPGGREVSMSQSGIAWSSDKENKFKNPSGVDATLVRTPGTVNTMFLWNNPNYSLIIPGVANQPATNETAWTEASPDYGVTNEHFIVWMRTAGLPNFRKLYGKINTKLVEGDVVTFTVQSNFVVSTFDGSKALVISTTSWFGGKNPFLGIAYITVGSICFVLALLFFLKHKISPRQLGDTRYLVWKNRQ